VLALLASDGSMPSRDNDRGSALSMHASIIGSEWDPCLSPAFHFLFLSLFGVSFCSPGTVNLLKLHVSHMPYAALAIWQ
jgi:hypothetical protein